MIWYIEYDRWSCQAKSVHIGHITMNRYPYKDTGNRLRALRGALSQAEFAKMLRLSLRAYQRYEHGERSPKLETVLRISALCDVSIEWIELGIAKDGDITKGVKELAEVVQYINEEAGYSLGEEFSPYEEYARLQKERPEFGSRIGQHAQRWDPREPKAIDMLRMVFRWGSETEKGLVVKALETALSLCRPNYGAKKKGGGGK